MFILKMLLLSLLLFPDNEQKYANILPCLQVLGFPIQLLGLVLLPYFGVKYLVEDGDALEDAKSAAVCFPDHCIMHCTSQGCPRYLHAAANNLCANDQTG